MTDSQTRTLDPALLAQLPTLPGSALEFVRLCDDPTVGVRDVADVANTDPGLVARIVQVANSPFYSPRQPITDVARAAAILGLRSLKMVGVGLAVLGELWGSTADSEELAGIIGASTIAGSASRSFSARMGTGRDEEALTAGLLSFIGELALLRCHPERFSGLWQAEGHLPTCAQQRAEFDTDGVELGLILMERWGMPQGLRGAVELRGESIDDRLRRRPDVFDAGLGFGTAVAELLSSRDPTIERLGPAARTWGLTHDDLLKLWGEFRLGVRRTSQQMGFDVGAELDALIVDAREEYLTSPVHAMSELDEAKRVIDELRSENERLEGLSVTDPLTGAPNRIAFLGHLHSALAGLTRVGDAAVGVAMFDLDHFKAINDRNGHLVGDAVLRAVAEAAIEAARGNELFARLGGDEFAMVLRPASPDELLGALERIRRVMCSATQGVPGGERVTISAGAAWVSEVNGDVAEIETALIEAADQALYEAKRQGRNASVIGG